LVLARKQQFGAVPLNAHAHCAVGRVKASVASGLVRRAEIFGHVLDDNGLGLWACPDATLASPHAALAAHRARLDRSGTVLVVRVVGVAALAVVDRLREAVGPLLRHALDLVFGHAVTQRGAVASHHDVVGHLSLLDAVPRRTGAGPFRQCQSSSVTPSRARQRASNRAPWASSAASHAAVHAAFRAARVETLVWAISS